MPRKPCDLTRAQRDRIAGYVFELDQMKIPGLVTYHQVRNPSPDVVLNPRQKQLPSRSLRCFLHLLVKACLSLYRDWRHFHRG